jgi:hypothetical protein
MTAWQSVPITNGKAELVMQNAAACQKLLDIAEEAKVLASKGRKELDP